jgi:hypothetical protein
MNIYIITNYRILPYLAILNELIKNRKKAKLVLISRETLYYFDYGEYLPSWNKRLKIFFLRFFCKVLILNSRNPKAEEEIDPTGLISSLMSITNDSNANKIKYPELYFNFYKLAIGAYNVQLYLERLEVPFELFLFNGRGASQFQIALYATRNNIKISYFEYGNSLIKGYKLFPYIPHSLFNIGLDLIKIYNADNKSRILSLEQKSIANNIISEKLNNVFTYNLVKTDYAFDVVVFLGSDHEYTGLSEEISNFRLLGNLKLCDYAYNKYGSNNTLAVRAHPNQQVDPSAKLTNNIIKNFCKSNGIVFFDYDSRVSSHSLIKNCSIVVTEYSSISFDAIYLEKELDILGDSDLKAILSQMPIEIKSLGPKEIKFYVAYLKYLEIDLYFHSFNFMFKIICLFFTTIEKKYILKSALIK